MDLKALLLNLTAKYYGDLTVGNTVGGVGFDAAKLSWRGLPAKLVRVTVEGGDCRYREDGGAPTATSGDLVVAGDEFFVGGEENAVDFRAIRTGVNNGTIRYHVYF